MEGKEDPFKAEIPEPSDSIIDQLLRTTINFEDEVPLSDTIKESIGNVLKKVTESETQVIDIIGSQMEFLSAEFEECIKSTQELFVALARLKDAETKVIDEKLEATTLLAKNIETTMGCIRKIGGEK